MQQFFKFARERHNIYLRRAEGQSRPWTKDKILRKYRFTNVYRELDATTVWFRQNVRGPLRDTPEVLLATVLFRWFNRSHTGDAIFRQIGDYSGRGQARTAFEQFLLDGEVGSLRHAVTTFCGKGPYVTGAYIIKTPDSYTKLDGVLRCIEWFNTEAHNKRDRPKYSWRQYAEILLKERGGHTLEEAWEYFREFPYLGDFMAYEIVTDLRHTAMLDRAPDIMSWANPGPGAKRGLNRLNGRELKQNVYRQDFIQEMREILYASQNRENWPREWPMLEMRDIEHTLCEFDKYERARLGQGKPRGVYK